MHTQNMSFSVYLLSFFNLSYLLLLKRKHQQKIRTFYWRVTKKIKASTDQQPNVNNTETTAMMLMIPFNPSTC